jgi:membrane protease YdiL (CAAX protease family)
MDKRVVLYTLLAYAFTWTILFALQAAYTASFISKDQMNLLYNFGALGPSIAAVITAYTFYKKAGVTALFSRITLKGVNRSSLLLMLSPLVLMLVGVLLYPVLSGSPYSFSITQEQFHLTSLVSYVGWALPFVSYAVFEELGWRGFLLPHLQEKYSAFKATVILWAIWALWHIPMFFTRFEFSPGIAVGFFIGIFVGSMILTSLFNQSRGSILAVILFHLTNNIASALDHEYIVAAVSTGFVFIALYLLFRYKTQNLANTERTRNYFIGKID